MRDVVKRVDGRWRALEHGRRRMARLALLADAHTFLFADLAGFTAMTEAHGDEPAADLAEEFVQLVRELLPAHGAHEVKLIGDAIMLRVPEPANAVRLGLAIVCDVGLRHGSPTVRVGMHTGTAVERSGDWYGSTVNIAARVAGLAGGGEVLLTDATHDAAEPLTDVEFASRGAHQLKNVSEPIRVYAAESHDPSAKRDWPIDPVCRMAVDPERRAGVLTHNGREYSFCSMRCIATFSQAPERYTQPEAT
jgi:class 3 adenylate cyclase/YHS domain-containing protein